MFRPKCKLVEMLRSQCPWGSRVGLDCAARARCVGAVLGWEGGACGRAHSVSPSLAGPAQPAPPLRVPPSQPRPTLAAAGRREPGAGWHCGLKQAFPAAARPQPWAPRGSPGWPDPVVAPELAPRARLLQPLRTPQPCPLPKLAS